jgi:acetoin utilization deacetylase AcuC-like enzyme
MTSKRSVSYFYDADVGSFLYGEGHPMRPFRINMTHQLIMAYGLYRKMNVYVSNKIFPNCKFLATKSRNRLIDDGVSFS